MQTHGDVEAYSIGEQVRTFWREGTVHRKDRQLLEMGGDLLLS